MTGHTNLERPEEPVRVNDIAARAFGLSGILANTSAAGAIHLDIGGCLKNYASQFTVQRQLHYVGVEVACLGPRSDAMEPDGQRQSDTSDAYETLLSIVNGRPIASITCLEALEYVGDCRRLLQSVSRLADANRCPVVVGAWNVAHREIGFSLALGVWAFPQGSPARYFDHSSFAAALAKSGLVQVEAHDIASGSTGIGLLPARLVPASGTKLHTFLSRLRDDSDSFGEVVQFLRICAAGPKVLPPSALEPERMPSPFLSVVIRTQARRMHTFAEALLALSGQTDLDFEVIVLGHKLQEDSVLSVRQAIEDMPQWFQEKVRLELVAIGNRTTPLNVGFALARGNYISILDDDDLPMAHWVEIFRKLDAHAPGRLLRAVAVTQDVRNVQVDGRSGLRGESSLHRTYPPQFDMIAQLRRNLSPTNCLAFPRVVFHDLNQRFDEQLTTTEDWDYIMRVAAIAGVASSPQITSIYRWWVTDESSRTIHPNQEWSDNEAAIFAKIDSRPFLLPAGATARLRAMQDTIERLEHAELMRKTRKRGLLSRLGRSMRKRLRRLRVVLGMGSE